MSKENEQPRGVPTGQSHKVYPVLQLSTNEEDVFRLVVVDGETTGNLLDVIFHNGQNDFVPTKNRCSISVGDVIFLDGDMYIIRPIGFRQINMDELQVLRKLSRRDRLFHPLVRP